MHTIKYSCYIYLSRLESINELNKIIVLCSITFFSFVLYIYITIYTTHQHNNIVPRYIIKIVFTSKYIQISIHVCLTYILPMVFYNNIVMSDSAWEAFVPFPSSILCTLTLQCARRVSLTTKNVMGDRRSIGFEVQRWDRPEFTNITHNNSPCTGRHPIALIFLISYFDFIDPPSGDSISHSPNLYALHLATPRIDLTQTPPATLPAHPGHHQRIYYYKTNAQTYRA